MKKAGYKYDKKDLDNRMNILLKTVNGLPFLVGIGLLELAKIQTNEQMNNQITADALAGLRDSLKK